MIALKLEQFGVNMPDYKEMYLTLFRSVTRAIAILQEAQQQIEEIYISEERPNIRVIDISNQEKAPPEKE
jgi:hypothetical protein